MKLISFFVCIMFAFSNEYKISKIIDENTLLINTSENININKTIFILSEKNHISALGEITKKEANTYKINVIDKNPFKNKNIPYLKYKLNINDKVIDKLFDNNIMILAPDFSSYQKVKQQFKNKNILSPDLLVAFTNGEKDLEKEDFFSFAKHYNCSYYYFVFNDGIYIKDALTLKTIDVIKQNINHNSKKHHVFNNIQNSYTDIGFSFVDDGFDEYYKNIAKQSKGNK